jgi:hypothetical protein
MLLELSKAVSKIGNALPRAQLQYDTFKTDQVQELLQELRTYIAEFLSRSLEWYEQRPLKHALKSFTSPYKLKFSDLEDKIDAVARQIDKVTQTLTQVKIMEMSKQMQEMLDMQRDGYHLIRSHSDEAQISRDMLLKLQYTVEGKSAESP